MQNDDDRSRIEYSENQLDTQSVYNLERKGNITHTLPVSELLPDLVVQFPLTSS